MAIYIKRFQNDAEYQHFLSSSDFIRPNVSSIQELKRAFYHSINNKTSLSNAKVGDVVLYDIKNDTKIAISQSALNINDYPTSQFVPVGVVVIPASHDVYNTGECAIISLDAMHYNYPDTGSDNEKLSWGGRGLDIDNLTNYVQLPLIDTNLQSNDIIGGLEDAAYMPSSKFTDIKPVKGNGLDANAGYFKGEYSVEFKTIPSPYVENGQKNASYSTQTVDANALSDFNGKLNTEVVLKNATAQGDWKTALTIENKTGAGFYPVACCCWRYTTLGTSQGDWYLPALGELGYLMARFDEVQKGIQTVKDTYNVGYTMREDKSMWSSTEFSDTKVRYIDTEDGRVGTTDKAYSLYARAFLRA